MKGFQNLTLKTKYSALPLHTLYVNRGFLQTSSLLAFSSPSSQLTQCKSVNKKNPYLKNTFNQGLPQTSSLSASSPPSSLNTISTLDPGWHLPCQRWAAFQKLQQMWMRKKSSFHASHYAQSYFSCHLQVILNLAILWIVLQIYFMGWRSFADLWKK